MLVARPTTLAEVFDALDELPDAHLLAGGTDFMVEVNFGHRRPPAVVALRRVEELRGYDVLDDEVVLRAGTTWTEIENGLVEVLPALAAAARTVGSPQMRNAGTVGGNIGTASPAGDGGQVRPAGRRRRHPHHRPARHGRVPPPRRRRRRRPSAAEEPCRMSA